MAIQGDELLKKPLYVFDLPQELLVSLALKESGRLQPAPQISPEPDPAVEDPDKADIQTTKTKTSCLLCNTTFANVQQQRQHSKSDWHNYNLKQKLNSRNIVGENEFEKLVDELDESISGSESDTSGSEAIDGAAKESTLSALLKKQAKLSDGIHEEEGVVLQRKTRDSGKPPLIWFSTPIIPSNISVGIYRALFTNAEQEAQSIVEILQRKQLRPIAAKALVDNSNGVPLPSTMTSPSIAMFMIGGGHFAGMIVSLAPKVSKHSPGTEQRQAIVIAHKTFHRYTTRRKQGGGQSANDAAKGAAHSAGSSLRRYNEVALEQEVRALLADWKEMISGCQLTFIRATGTSNRRVLFGPYEGQILRQNDSRNRTFPFSTRRATQAELMRSFVELTRVKVSQVDEAALAAAAATAAASVKGEADKQKALAQSKTDIARMKPSKEEEAATLHTNQIQALIRRSKAPALLQYLTNNSISADFSFHPPTTQANHHAPRPLHLASSVNSAFIVLALLTKAGANPALPNAKAKVPFDLAGDRATRDAFRVARSELGESRWNWELAKIPPALSKVEADKREARERAEAERSEMERRRAEEERLKKEGPIVREVTTGKKTLGLKEVKTPKTAEEKREEEGRGMTPEMRTKLERERRARAAEARMRGG